MTFITHLHISIADQCLLAYSQQEQVARYRISTAKNGAGERSGSGCTPRGEHIIRAKIGAGLPYAAVLKGRRWTQEICTSELYQAYPKRDWILSRILWLSGTELGRNRLGQVDTFQRYIYIHGTPDEEPMGIAMSHGCIRMRNADIIQLFDQVILGCRVTISEKSLQA